MNVCFQFRKKFYFELILDDIAGRGYFKKENSELRIYTQDKNIINIIRQFLLLYKFINDVMIINILD